MLIPPDSIEFAKAHLQAYYDSDFFPRSVAFDALWPQWDRVAKWLAGTALENQPVWLPRTVPAPKAGGGYRIVHQLHPLNAIAYTALAHMVAETIEAKRQAPTVACSYRIELSGGSFFKADNGYSLFIAQCELHAASNRHVLLADISDFYNRVYLHRLSNAIEHFNPVMNKIASAIERFLIRLNDKASQGIPVGPAASIVLAEALCHDIDEFISNKGFKHARYVDDIRIFGDSKQELDSLLEELALYIHGAHRLQLAWRKSFVIGSKKFRAQYLTSPERVERQELLGVARELSAYPDMVSDSDISDLARRALEPEPAATEEIGSTRHGFAGLLVAIERAERFERNAIREQGFRRLLSIALHGKRLDLGLSRLVLRRSRTLGVTGLGIFLLRHLRQLSPVCPDVFLYLQKEPVDPALVEVVRRHCHSRTTSIGAFARYWFEWWVSGNSALLSDPIIRSYALEKAGVENQLRAATTLRSLARLRSSRGQFPSLGLWERHAALHAAHVMPTDERVNWLKATQLNSTDPCEEWIASWAKVQ